MTPNWDDPSFTIASDPARRARYRRLQSWYRQTVLGLNALNFLRDERLARIALDRLAES